jgi:hypothetical protein
MQGAQSVLFAVAEMQASQRERVSLAALPLSQQEQRAVRRRKHKRWKELLRPDYFMGVPQVHAAGR